MTTLLISLALDPDRSQEVIRYLRTDLARWIRRLPGFESSHWLLSEDRAHCTVTLTFDDRGPADQVAEALLATDPNPARAWNVDRVEHVWDLGLAHDPAV